MILFLNGADIRALASEPFRERASWTASSWAASASVTRMRPRSSGSSIGRRAFEAGAHGCPPGSLRSPVDNYFSSVRKLLRSVLAVKTVATSGLREHSNRGSPGGAQAAGGLSAGAERCSPWTSWIQGPLPLRSAGPATGELSDR